VVSDDDGASWTRVPDDESAFGGEGQHLMWSVIGTDSGFVLQGPTCGLRRTVGSGTGRAMEQVRRIVRTADGYVAVGLTSRAAAMWTSADALSWTPVAVAAIPAAAPEEVWRCAAIDAVAGPMEWSRWEQAQLVTATFNDSDGACGWPARRVSGPGSRGLRCVCRCSGTRRSGGALIGDRLVAVGTQRPSRFTTMDQHGPDVRFGPALSWVSGDGGRTWVRVEAEALGSARADVSMTAVATLGGKVVAIGNDGLDLAVWIGTWN